jgi:non-lysosomal glucosylceramidase
MFQWGALLGKAAQSYLRKLWNGACFSFDESPRGDDVIMADQLAGYWYMRLGGASAPPPLWHAAKVHSALRLIFEHNVQKFAGGKLGESKDYTNVRFQI